MAFAGYNTFLSSLQEQISINSNITVNAIATARLHDLFSASLNPVTGVISAAPTTAVALNKSNTSALNYYLPDYSTDSPYLIGSRTASAIATGVYFIIDRLSHQGGLSAIVTTAQTTNLPTAALTRYTDGVGVMIGLTLYSAIGATATTVTASYTNQAGTAGKTTVAQSFGGSFTNNAHRMIFLPLEAGDTGVRSVESVTVSATTGGAGNFGVTLFKILGAICLDNLQNTSVNDIITGGFIGGIPSFSDSAHLGLLSLLNTSTTTGSVSILTGKS
jgi:hypothetical protein